MIITTFLRHNSLKLALTFAIFGFLCWLYCLSPLTLNLSQLQQVAIYIGLEVLYDMLRHWCLKLVQSGCDRLRHVSPFVNDLFAVVTKLATDGRNFKIHLPTVTGQMWTIYPLRVLS